MLHQATCCWSSANKGSTADSKQRQGGPPGLQLCFQALEASLLHGVQLAQV